MNDETEFMEMTGGDDGDDIACSCGATLDLIFEDDGSVICEECLYSRECDDD